MTPPRAGRAGCIRKFWVRAFRGGRARSPLALAQAAPRPRRSTRRTAASSAAASKWRRSCEATATRPTRASSRRSPAPAGSAARGAPRPSVWSRASRKTRQARPSSSRGHRGRPVLRARRDARGRPMSCPHREGAAGLHGAAQHRDRDHAAHGGHQRRRRRAELHDEPCRGMPP